MMESKFTGFTVNSVTEATKAVKRDLSSFGCRAISEATVEEDVMNILKTANKDDKHFIQMQLFLHLGYPELDPIFEDPGDFVYLIPPLTFPGLSSEMFCRVVVRRGLIYNFMQMVDVLYDKPFIQNLCDQVINFLRNYEEDNDERRLSFPYVLFMLMKLNRRLEMNENTASAEGTGDVYSNLFYKFLDSFGNEDKIPRYEKLAYLLRLAGVSCMKTSIPQNPIGRQWALTLAEIDDFNVNVLTLRDPSRFWGMKTSDYVGTGSDLFELIDEWNYDLTYRVAKKTTEYFRELFKRTGIEQELNPVKSNILEAINQAIKKLSVTDEEEKQWLETKKGSRMTQLEFVGVHAFLTKSLLEKYSSELDKQGAVDDLLAHSTKYSSYKLKVTCDDFDAEKGDIKQFFKVIRRFGQKERDRKTLLPQFLEFSYEDMFLSNEGAKIAEKYLIPKGEFDVALRYIKKALDFETITQRSLHEEIKLAALRLLCINPEVKARKAELVTEIFKDGVHAHFALSEFTLNVNQICAKIGSIEKESKLAKVEQHEDTIFYICFQNPREAVESLMKQSIRSQQYKVLCIAKPFLCLPSGPPTSKKTCPLVNLCFQRIVDGLDEEDRLLEAIVKSIPDLISNDIIKPQDLYALLVKKISNMFTANTLELGKISKLFSMVHALTTTILDISRFPDGSECLDEKFIREILTFSINSWKLTCEYLNKKTYKAMLQIRKECLKIREEIMKANGIKIELPDLVKEMKNPEKMKELTLGSVGFIFIRIPYLQDHIRAFLMREDNPMDYSHGQLLENLLMWVLNSDPDEEWGVLIEFLRKVIFASEKLKNKNPINLISDGLYGAMESSVVLEAPFIIRLYLKFYKECINSLFKEIQDQTSIVEALVILILEMNSVLKKRKTQKEKAADDTSIQQAFLLMLDVVELIVASDSDFETTLQEKLLNLVTLLPKTPGQSEPIQRCILQRILKNKKANMLPLPAEKESHKQTLLERTANLTMDVDESTHGEGISEGGRFA